MSKTLWIYGDSFAVDWKVEWGWQRLLTAGLPDVDRVVNQACAGCSNDWIARTFRDDAQQPGDYVVLMPTESSRQGFWKDRPHLSNLPSIVDTKDAAELKRQEPEKYQAVLDYFIYLQDHKVDELRLEHFGYAVRVLMIERELNLRVIPSFLTNWNYTDLVFVNGNMTFSVCDQEFTSKHEMDLWYAQSIDTRANHMTQHNHRVFADKLLNSFHNGQPIDLETDFKRHMLTHRDKLTAQGLCNELLAMARAPGNTIPS